MLGPDHDLESCQRTLFAISGYICDACDVFRTIQQKKKQ